MGLTLFCVKANPQGMKAFDLVIPVQSTLRILQPQVLNSQYLIVPQSIWRCILSSSLSLSPSGAAWLTKTSGIQESNRKYLHFTDVGNEVQRTCVLCAGSLVHSP